MFMTHEKVIVVSIIFQDEIDYATPEAAINIFVENKYVSHIHIYTKMVKVKLHWEDNCLVTHIGCVINNNYIMSIIRVRDFSQI